MAADADSDGLLIHASCVAWSGRSVLIRGASGSGKSTLALELMAFGCELVSDDQTKLNARLGKLTAAAPATIRGKIEARGIGILAASVAKTNTVVMSVDLDHAEENRLPLQRSETYLGVSLPVYYVSSHAGFAAAILQLLKTGGQRV